MPKWIFQKTSTDQQGVRIFQVTLLTQKTCPLKHNIHNYAEQKTANKARKGL